MLYEVITDLPVPTAYPVDLHAQMETVGKSVGQDVGEFLDAVAKRHP